MNRCIRGGYLVDGTRTLPVDPTEYDSEGPPVAGCNSLQCRSCGASVRNAPRLAFRSKDDLTNGQLSALYATVDLACSPLLHSGDRVWRLYLCRCSRWLERERHACDEPDRDDWDPDVPWRCQGHPPLTLPHSIDGVLVTTHEDLRAVVLRAFHGDDQNGGAWLARLHARLQQADASVLRSVALACLEETSPRTRALALSFFHFLPNEIARERVRALLEQNRALFAGVPDDVTSISVDKTLEDTARRILEPQEQEQEPEPELEEVPVAVASLASVETTSFRAASEDPRFAGALESWDLRETIVSSSEPLGVYLRQVGAYFRANHEEVDFTDWNGAIVGRGDGPLIRDAIPPSRELPFTEIAPLLGMGAFARELVARHPSTPREVLAQLAADALYDVQRAVLERTDGDARVQVVLAQSDFPSIQDSLSYRPTLTADAVEALVRGDNREAKIRLLGHAVLSGAMLARLAEDADPSVRCRAIAGPRAEMAWLEKAAEDPSEWVRCAAARNPKTPAHALARIATQPTTRETCLALSAHPSTPPPVLTKLFEQSDPEVREAILRHPAVPDALVQAAAKDVDPIVRKTIAARASLTEEQARAFAQDPAPSVRIALARNGTHEAILARMVDDKSVGVRLSLAINPSFTALEDLATDPQDEVRVALAARADLPDSVREALASDTWTNVRVALAKSPATPRSMCARLASDVNERVRAAAKEQLAAKR